MLNIIAKCFLKTELNFKPKKFRYMKNFYNLKINRCRILPPPNFNLPLNCIFLPLNIAISLVAITGNALVIFTPTHI